MIKKPFVYSMVVRMTDCNLGKLILLFFLMNPFYQPINMYGVIFYIYVVMVVIVQWHATWPSSSFRNMKVPISCVQASA